MLIPQFSLRFLLAVTTVAALVCLVISLAVQGHQWAAGVSIGLLALAVALALHGLLFFLVWLFSLLSRFRSKSDL